MNRFDIRLETELLEHLRTHGPMEATTIFSNACRKIPSALSYEAT
jgi:hypothetical protein